MIFDVNIAGGRWPFRPARFKTLTEELNHLAGFGIRGGVVRSLDAPLAGNLEEANRQLSEECAAHPGFFPAAALRPDYGAWREYRGKAAALYPVFHGYELHDERTLEMGSFLAKQGTVLFIVAREEDPRGQHPLCRIPPVPVADVNRFAAALPEARIVLLNGYLGEVASLEADNVYAEFSSVETLNSLRVLLGMDGVSSRRKFPVERLLFGSGSPLLYPSAAVAKLHDAGLNEESVRQIKSINAGRLFHGKIGN